MMDIYIVWITIFAILLLIVSLFLILISSFYSDFKGAPFVSNNNDVIVKSLILAGLLNKDILIDLGCGNGKVLKMGLERFKCKKGIGYEVAYWPYLLSKLNLRKYLNKGSAVIYRENILKISVPKASVIYVYLFPKLLERLAPLLYEFLKSNSGSRIVSPAFHIEWDKHYIKHINTKEIEIFQKVWRRNIKIFLYTYKS